MRSPLRGSAVTLALLAGLLPAGAWPTPAPPEAAAQRLNVLLITLDALRADHLGCYGYPRPTTPHLDAFAVEATRFSQAFAQSSWTAPGVVSTLLGLYPSVHGLDARRKVADPLLPTPLKALAAAGYRVGGFLATGEVFAHLGFVPEDLLRRPLSDLLADQSEPFFVWYQLRGTHLPYRSSPEREAAFARPDSPPLPPRHRELLRGSEMIPAGTVDWYPEERPGIVDLYDAALRSQDEAVGEVLDRLAALGLADRTVVIVTADHGEELLDHGQVGHASTTLDGTVYDELLHVPLLIRLPGIAGGRVVDGLVEQVDVMPTVLELLGVEAPWPVQGQSLVAALRGEGDVGREAVFAETTPCGWQCRTEQQRSTRLRALRTREWKLVERTGPTGARQVRLFHLGADPGERHDVAGERPRVLSELSARLHRHLEEELHRAAELAAGVLGGLRAEVEAERAAGEPLAVAEVCDRVAMLRYLYRVENPSFLDQPGLAAAPRRLMRAVLAAVGPEADRYWGCREIGALAGGE